MTSRVIYRMRRAALASAAATVLAGSSCSTDAWRALVIGLDAAANQVYEDNRDVSFGDWVQSELDDLLD